MSSCDNTPNLISLEEAQQMLQNSVVSIVNKETVKLSDSLDRILASDVIASLNVPGYDNSAMDGYAIRAADLNKIDCYELIGKSFAGQAFEGEVKAGQTVRIMTGAPMPNGADTVVMQENAEIRDQGIRFNPLPSANANVRLKGNDIATNDKVLNAGQRISPIHIGILASIGIAEVEVLRPLKVGLFSTGDELCLPGTPLKEGSIYDSNRFMVAAILKRLGYEILDLGVIADDPEAIENAFIKCANECDAVISSGGVSVGEADFTRDILNKIGDIRFWKLALKPGKPFAFGKIKQCYFFGLPGNPVSAAITLHQLALPALQKMAGETAPAPLQIPVALGKDLKRKPGRTEFQRAILDYNENGSLQVISSGSQSSGMLSSMNISNAYIKLEPDQGKADQGDIVTVLPYDRWIS